ncbi:Undecaprenyl-phosphate galactose phosphotransferase WbaP/exopolysaccharide biosynthesis polyprenyl glycosylphosphotransferase [Humitalea rosea]|uniref:Undecaprenyl-phosphate galactose phosphotransferase WbaP/exopolysaccharide biosynthesis polyprenyl glycosylphosphotransferase n=1 Tax=Humitalea rosea TaxID=990373 RepID=A0A2W7HVC2_9PROT|nr:exopolysaccharide biosynthesis polyprenyl glycosylphosphotransferase [Humitalea rosea]PZW38691.1 Undecaprenyl-phosphate galactose phosphotransferase WbaP/exopolysaccharide biosynthesis polyprenyl glycosylphosphotransferase [Humitalea rosea]
MSNTFSDAASGFARAQRAVGGALRGLGLPHWMLRWLALPAADILAAALAVALTFMGFTMIGSAQAAMLTWNSAIPPAVTAALLISHLVLGLYDTTGHGSLERLRTRVIGVLATPCLTVTILAAFGMAGGPAFLPISLASVVAGPIGLLLEVLVRPFLIRHQAWGSPALLVGSGPSAVRLAERLQRQPALGLRPIGFASDARVGESMMPVANFGTIADAARLHGGAVAVVAMTSGVTTVDVARLPFRRVIAVPEDIGLPTLRVNFRSLGGDLGLEVSNLAQAEGQRWVKRCIELCIAVPALLVALPLIGLMVLMIRLISPGPAIYVQSRIGFHGQPVAILKLRTMHRDAEGLLAELLARDAGAREEWNRYMKLTRDPRVLPWIGDFLRRSSLDELPQLWNVLRGDLSLVGPRPFPGYHIERFSTEFQKLRESVKPGLTGLWQISERSNADLRQQEAIDTFYIQNWSLWLDLYIVLKTLPAVLAARGAR